MHLVVIKNNVIVTRQQQTVKFLTSILWRLPWASCQIQAEKRMIQNKLPYSLFNFAPNPLVRFLTAQRQKKGEMRVTSPLGVRVQIPAAPPTPIQPHLAKISLT